ncbi:MAG: hypothetical protein ACK41Q_09090, partial [Candidatus Brocadia sp.]
AALGSSTKTRTNMACQYHPLQTCGAIVGVKYFSPLLYQVYKSEIVSLPDIYSEIYCALAPPFPSAVLGKAQILIVGDKTQLMFGIQ